MFQVPIDEDPEAAKVVSPADPYRAGGQAEEDGCHRQPDGLHHQRPEQDERQPGAGEAPEIPTEDVGHPCVVSNRKQRTVHRIRIGPPQLDPAAWAAFCGWRFGASRMAGAAQQEWRSCPFCPTV